MPRKARTRRSPARFTAVHKAKTRTRAHSCCSCRLAIFQNGAAGYSCVCVSAAIYIYIFPERLLAFPASDCDGTQMCFPFPPAARAPPGGVSGQRGGSRRRRMSAAAWAASGAGGIPVDGCLLISASRCFLDGIPRWQLNYANLIATAKLVGTLLYKTINKGKTALKYAKDAGNRVQTEGADCQLNCVFLRSCRTQTMLLVEPCVCCVCATFFLRVLRLFWHCFCLFGI